MGVVHVAAGRKARAKTAEARKSASRDLAAAQIADYAAKIVADAPPLTEGQLAHIAAVLRDGQA